MLLIFLLLNATAMDDSHDPEMPDIFDELVELAAGTPARGAYVTTPPPPHIKQCRREREQYQVPGPFLFLTPRLRLHVSLRPHQAFTPNSPFNPQTTRTPVPDSNKRPTLYTRLPHTRTNTSYTHHTKHKAQNTKWLIMMIWCLP